MGRDLEGRRIDSAALRDLLLRATARVRNGDSLEKVEDCGMRGVMKKAVGGGCRSRGGSVGQELFAGGLSRAAGEVVGP